MAEGTRPNMFSREESEARRMMLEMYQLKKKLEASLDESKIHYSRLKDAYDQTIVSLRTIEPKLEKSKRYTNISQVAGNAGFVVGGIITGVGILTAPLADKLSLRLTLTGAGIMRTGGVVTVSATLGSYFVRKVKLTEATVLLKTFKSQKQEFLKELDIVFEICQIINEKSQLDTHQEVFGKAFPENSVLFNILKFCEGNSSVHQSFNKARRTETLAEGVNIFAHLVEDLATEGAKITKSAVAKILFPLGVLLDSAFLVASIVELLQNRKCKVSQLVDLMKETIQKEMGDLDEMYKNVHYFEFR